MRRGAKVNFASAPQKDTLYSCPGVNILGVLISYTGGHINRALTSCNLTRGEKTQTYQRIEYIIRFEFLISAAHRVISFYYLFIDA